jgi:hypothetical protein
MSREPELSRGVKILIAVFAVKLAWDVIHIALTWPDLSYPKLGIAIALPGILWGLTRGMNWALIFAGVVCTFWIAFVVARLVGPIFVIGEIDVPFPWSNLLGFPAIVFVMNNMKTDEEIRQASEE